MHSKANQSRSRLKLSNKILIYAKILIELRLFTLILTKNPFEYFKLTPLNLKVLQNIIDENLVETLGNFFLTE